MSKQEVTEELMRETFTRIRKPNWPRTFEEMLCNSVLSAIVRAHAALTLRGVRVSYNEQQGTLQRAGPAPRTPPPHVRTRGAGVDMKRMAAGDSDDDE